MKNSIFNLPKASAVLDRDQLNAELLKISIPNIKIVLTGKGRVGSGAKEILDFLNIKQVSVYEYLNKSFNEPVYVQIDVLDYNERIDNAVLDRFDFYKNPNAVSYTHLRAHET